MYMYINQSTLGKMYINQSTSGKKPLAIPVQYDCMIFISKKQPIISLTTNNYIVKDTSFGHPFKDVFFSLTFVNYNC